MKACVSARSLAAVRSDLARISVTVASWEFFRREVCIVVNVKAEREGMFLSFLLFDGKRELKIIKKKLQLWLFEPRKSGTYQVLGSGNHLNCVC